MKVVFIVHGYKGWPNGGWRTWLMSELEKKEIYACSLPMPNPDDPVCEEWIGEIKRVVGQNSNNEIYLVGHSLGSTAILRFLETTDSKNIKGVILASGPIKPVGNGNINNFLETPFDFEKIKNKAQKFLIIHGSNDDRVPFEHAQVLSKALDCKLVTVENGGHLNGSAGWKTLPQVLAGLE